MFWSKAREKYSDVSAEDDDVRRFHALSNNFQTDVYEGLAGRIQDQGHRWIAQRTPPGLILEIGFGAGRHLLFHAGRREDYIASEYSSAHVQSPRWHEMRGRILRCDARQLPFPASLFAAVISVYNLEHIADLAAVFREVRRVLVPGGRFLVALPCEGGLAWNLGRELTTRRHFQRRYGINYDKIIAYEHLRDYRGVRRELWRSGCFEIVSRAYLPFGLPTPELNLVACLDCRRIGPDAALARSAQ